MERLSQHPVDRLIRELIQSGRPATAEEVARIIDRMATAPFDPRIMGVPLDLRDQPYRGRQLGARSDSLFVHLVKRVVIDNQWRMGTTPGQYLNDLRQAVRVPGARLAVYVRRGGNVAATLTDTTSAVAPQRRGPDLLPALLVVYSADRGIIITGYQVSGLETTSVPGDAQWLK